MYVYGYLVWILTALLYLYYTVSNKYIQSHRNRTVYMCTIARNRYCEFIINFKFNDCMTIACKEHHCQHSGLPPDSGQVYVARCA